MTVADLIIKSTTAGAVVGVAAVAATAAPSTPSPVPSRFNRHGGRSPENCVQGYERCLAEVRATPWLGVQLMFPEGLIRRQAGLAWPNNQSQRPTISRLHSGTPWS
jgi:hypothetical protein